MGLNNTSGSFNLAAFWGLGVKKERAPSGPSQAAPETEIAGKEESDEGLVGGRGAGEGWGDTVGGGGGEQPGASSTPCFPVPPRASGPCKDVEEIPFSV